LDALERTLAEAQEADEPFQVVHFDGHGVLPGQKAEASEPGMHQDVAAEGTLIFQAVDGGPDLVPASRVARVLAAARVPVVVLNACQSGAVGKQLEAAVATRLLQGGAASVVAMAYRVYAVAAAEFMAAFYERLFAGDPVSVAVTAGRQRLFRHDRRPSPKGDLPLADWVVPVHYVRREVRFPGLVTARPKGGPSLEEALDQLAGAGPAGVGGVLAPVGVFTGRDGLFYELETAARLQKVVILQGLAGTGKTELAKAFGRWWEDTGAVERPEWVFWHSFEPGLASFGLDGVITEIGLEVFGPGFARLDAAQQIGVIERFLRDRRALLIWDNFESVRSVPDPSAATPALDEAGCQQLRGFLGTLAAGGRSAALITSRAEESWLDDRTASGPGAAAPVRLHRLRVGGLTSEEAAQYAGDLLAPFPAAAPRRADRAFGELMQWLDGHPLSMRLVLPHLDSTDPKALLAGLQGTAPLPGWDDGQGGRLTSLPASLGYSHARLDPVSQKLLAAVCLFHDTADAAVLTAFSGIQGVPQRFRAISVATWDEVLAASAGAGLLTRLGRGMYRIHPALPAYLATRWRTEEGAGYDDQRAAATQALLVAHAVSGVWLRQQIQSGDAGFAYTSIGLQQRTMGHLLGFALDGQFWAEAQAIAEPLTLYWDGRGRSAEAAAWTDRVRLATEDADGVPPGLDSAAGSLWLFFVGDQARRQVTSGGLDAADRTYREILAMLQAQPTSPAQQEHLAVAQHQLGRVAEEQGQLDEAADWYARALAIEEKLGDRLKMAGAYHQLGNVASVRGWLDEATEWYARALAIRAELGDRPGMAASYHQLGSVAFVRGQLDEAAEWYARALAIEGELGDRPGMAASYHQLGSVAAVRRQLDEAAEWYARALAIRAELGDRPGISYSCGQLGLLAEARGSPGQALEWIVQSVALFEDFPHPSTGPDPDHLARLTHQLGIQALEACWQRVTGGPLPGAVRDYVRAHHPDTGDTSEGAGQ
jgi:tetratricopeptide (TPR) repeat protein